MLVCFLFFAFLLYCLFFTINIVYCNITVLWLLWRTHFLVCRTNKMILIIIYVHECAPQQGYSTKRNGIMSLAAPEKCFKYWSYQSHYIYITILCFSIHDLTVSWPQLNVGNTVHPSWPRHLLLLFFFFFFFKNGVWFFFSLRESVGFYARWTDWEGKLFPGNAWSSPSFSSFW